MLSSEKTVEVETSEEIARAVTRLQRSRGNLYRSLVGRKWRNTKESNSEWVFGKKDRLNFNRGTHHGKGRWQVVDGTVVVTTLRGIFIIDFDLGAERGHTEGIQGDGGRADPWMVPRLD